MKLAKYLDIYWDSHAAFARCAEMPQTTLSQIVHGAGCNALNSQKIIKTSGGLVTLKDLAKQTPSKGGANSG